MVTMSSNQYGGVVKAFTLIELLVVISIIALLISILLPALQSAKWRVKVLTCMAQLQQVGVGLNTYVADDPDYQYPPRFSVSGARVWSKIASGGRKPDGRVNWLNITGGRPEDILFCPFVQFAPEYDLSCNDQNEWSCHYVATTHTYEVGYMMFLLFLEGHFNWMRSGNPDIDGNGKRNGPYRPGDSDAAIITDLNWRWAQSCGNPKNNPCFAMHTGLSSCHKPMEFIDSNALFGDGHVVTRNAITNIVQRYDQNQQVY